jgi:hypothetical protein
MRSTLILLTLVAACSKSDPPQVAAISDEELAGYQKGAEVKREEIIHTWPTWLARPEGCPADQMPAQFIEHEVSLERCQGEKVKACLKKCKFFDPAACYSAALILQSPEREVDAVSPALFAQACKYGSASGCTNWTAGLLLKSMKRDSPEYTECQERSFELSCTRGEDPWGCAMFAHALAEKGPLQEDMPRIEKAAAVACRFGGSDPACQTAQGTLRSIVERNVAKEEGVAKEKGVTDPSH